MFIETEGTPNPATLKFQPGRDVMGTRTADFASAEAAGVYSGPALGTDPAQELDGNSGPLFPSTTAETTG